MYSEYQYSPTDLDDELFLSEIPMSVLQNSIDTQFRYPLEYRKKDYVQSFIMKYQFSRDNMYDDDLVLLDMQYEKFLLFLDKTFHTYLNVGFTNIDSLPEEDVLELVHLTYRYFIKNIKKNFVNIVTNYIEENREEIESNYEKKKDVTTLTFRTEIDNEYDSLVLSNLGDIIDDIFDNLKTKDDVDYFFELCKSDESVLELEYVIHAYNEMELTGNFIENYIDMIDESFKTEIQSKVRNKILKKYPKRETKNIENEEMTEENETEDTDEARE